MATPINFYNALAEGEAARAANALQASIAAVSREIQPQQVDHAVADDAEDNSEEEVVLPIIQPLNSLLGIDPAVYEQINQALSTKRHIIFYGPPGTGKTTLAEYVATFIAADFVLVTGTSDWTSQDIVGGYQPVGDGQIEFVPGVLLENFDRPIIIDELNRVDIDKAIGPLFTVLSGQQTTLPYQRKLGKEDSKRIQILPKRNGQLSDHQYAPSTDWRIFATINTVDKASLYQMSYALSRRFAWILIDLPPNLNAFVLDYLNLIGQAAAAPEAGYTCPLSDLWNVVNGIRAMGPAPIIDIVKLCLKAKEDFDFFKSDPDEEAQRLYLNGFYLFLLPMLDGMLVAQSTKLTEDIARIFSLRGAMLAEVTKRVELHAI